MNRLELSLVLPAYNEEDTIEEVMKKVDHIVGQMAVEYELIVVDDGSVDGTRKRAVNYAMNNGHVRVVGHCDNVGKGYAMKTGFSHAGGSIVIFMDSDMEIDPEQISRYVLALEHGDLAIASKRHPQSCVEVPLIRKFLSYGFNMLVKLLTGLNVRDTQTGLKAIRKEAAERFFSKLSVKRFAFDVELLTVASLNGLKIVELPINLRMTSSFSLMDVWRMLIDLLGITYRLRVLRCY